MKLLALFAASMVVLGTASDAGAISKLCLGGAGDTVDVPARPSFIVERWRMNDTFAFSDRPHAPRSQRRVFPHSVEVLDAYYARVTVRAEIGATFVDPGVLDRPCKGRTFRVAARWRRPAARVVPEAIVKDGGLHVRWPAWRPGAPMWFRVDWAYTAEALARGAHGRTMAGKETTWTNVADGVPVIVRVQTFLPDGTYAPAWQGWAKFQDRPLVSAGSPVRTRPRPVPVDPTFVVTRHDEPRFLAVTADGVRLPTTIALDDGAARVTVRAPAGTTFRVLRLPVLDPAAAPLFVATTDRAHDDPPELGALVPMWDRAGVHATLRFAHTLWDELEVAWALSHDELGQHAPRRGGGLDRHRMYAQLAIPAARLAGRSIVYVRITPLWRGTRGVPWQGWVQRDATGTLTFGSLPVTPTAPR